MIVPTRVPSTATPVLGYTTPTTTPSFSNSVPLDEPVRFKAQVKEEYIITVRNRHRGATYFLQMAKGPLAYCLIQNGEDLQLSEEGGVGVDAPIEYYALVSNQALATYIKTRFG